MAVPLFISFTALCFFFTAHIVIWRYGLIKVKRAALVIKISLFTYLFTAGLGFFFFNIELADHSWISCPLYMVFIMVYLHFYLGIDRSVSVRILGELYEAKNRSMDFEDLQSKYPKEDMVSRRLEQLVKSNYLIKRGREYSCTVKGRRIAKLNIFLRKVYLIEITG